MQTGFAIAKKPVLLIAPAYALPSPSLPLNSWYLAPLPGVQNPSEKWPSRYGPRPLPMRFCPSRESLETDPEVFATEKESRSFEILIALLSSDDLMAAHTSDAQKGSESKLLSGNIVRKCCRLVSRMRF
jgi:hypothetical protein